MNYFVGACILETNESDKCFIIDGSLTLQLHKYANVTIAQESARSIIHDAMMNDKLLSPSIPEVVKVRYLNDSYEMFLSSFTGENLAVPNPIYVQHVDEHENSDSIVAAVLGVVVALLCLIILASMYIRRRRRMRSTIDGESVEDECSGEENDKRKKRSARDPDGLCDDDLDRDLDLDLDNIVAGIDATDAHRSFRVDPRGSFHLGNHHYTADGVRYFSPHCALCLRSNTNGGNGKEADDETIEGDEHGDDLSYDFFAAKKFTDYNRYELGKAHSSMHVRHCKSVTCEICRQTGGVVFLKSHGRNNDPPPEMLL